MPYTSSTLSLLGSVNGQAVWHYRTTDALSVVCAAGYFNTSAPQFGVGDEILVTRTGTNAAPDSLRVLSASNTVVVATLPTIRSQSVALPVTAVASSEFTMSLPPCTIIRATAVTTTAYTGTTATVQIGTTLSGVDIVAAVSNKTQGLVPLTIVATGAKFAGGTIFIREAQTGATAVGLGILAVEYVAD